MEYVSNSQKLLIQDPYAYIFGYVREVFRSVGATRKNRIRVQKPCTPIVPCYLAYKSRQGSKNSNVRENPLCRISQILLHCESAWLSPPYPRSRWWAQLGEGAVGDFPLPDQVVLHVRARKDLQLWRALS